VTLGLLLLFLHITTMISAVTISYGPGLLFGLAIRSGQPDVVRGLIAVTRQTERLIPVLYVGGGILGLLTALNFGFNLLAPWLVIAYALFVVAMITGAGVHAPYHQRLEKLFATSRSGPFTPEEATAVADPRERAAAMVDYVVIVLLVFDMVVKPFS